MSSDPRAALAAFVAALEAHLELSAMRRGENDPAVVSAYQDVADAFEAYDDTLLDAYGEVTPLDIYSGDDEDDFEDAVDVEQDDDDDELGDVEDEDDGQYLGLDDEEYDTDNIDDTDDTGGSAGDGAGRRRGSTARDLSPDFR